jgi:hypothetical protein
MINNNQKGISVYITIVIMSVLLAVSLGLASIIVNGAKMADSLSNSVKAFHVADTGIERTLYEMFKNSNCTTPVTGNFGTNYTYSVTIAHTGGGTCLDTGTTIESLGTYGATKRKIEASY